MRQEGSENLHFIELLGRLRVGECTESDYDLLNTRLARTVRPDWNSLDWMNAPVIVSENTVKDAFNDRAARTFAVRNGKPLHYYYSVDCHRGKTIQEGPLQAYLNKLSSGLTNQRLGGLTSRDRNACDDNPKFRC